MGFTIAEMSLAGPLEREAELKQLSELLGAAQSGRRHVCVVEGPSGVGNRVCSTSAPAQPERSDFRSCGPAVAS